MDKNVNNDDFIEELPIEDKVKYKYKLTKEQLLSEEGLLLVKCMVRDGMTLESVAKELGINRRTFFLWRKENESLQEACRAGKRIVDYKVENALLKAALGYKTETVKTIIDNTPDKKGNRVVKVERTISETGPSVTACLAWLNNRKSEQWRKNTRGEVFELEDKYTGVTINITKGEPKEKVEDDNEDWGNDIA